MAAAVVAHTEPMLSECLTNELARVLREHRGAFTATLCGPSEVRYVFVLASTLSASAQHVTLRFEGSARQLGTQQSYGVRLAYGTHAFSAFIVKAPLTDITNAVLATTPTSTLRARVYKRARDWEVQSLEFTVERLHLALVLENLFQPQHAAQLPQHAATQVPPVL